MVKVRDFKRGWQGDVKLHLNDEAPRIGSGIRRVHAKVGNLKVKLTNPYTGRTATIPRGVFEKLVKSVAP